VAALTTFCKNLHSATLNPLFVFLFLKMSDVSFPVRLTEAETSSLLSLKSELQVDLSELPVDTEPDVYGDLKLLRFLSHCDHDVCKTAAMFRDFVSWRQQRGLAAVRQRLIDSNIDIESIPNLKKIAYHVLCRCVYKFTKYFDQLPANLLLKNGSGEVLLDKTGNVMSLEKTGMCNVRGYLNEVKELHSGEVCEIQVTDVEVEDVHLAYMELRSLILHRLSVERVELVHMTVIRDLAGLQMIDPRDLVVLKRIIHLNDLSQRYYAGTVGKIVFINTSWVFDKVTVSVYR
jgi:hypothetical protein